MKKHLLLPLALFGALTLQARQLTPAEALARAVGQEAPSRSSSPELVYTDRDDSTGTTGLYVFNRPDGQGFIVVSADDTAAPILGYSDSGTFNAVDMPDNLRAWLGQYTGEIAFAASRSATPYATATRPQRQSITPLCTTKWNQGAPYNDLCPLYQSSRSVTGCVATAMAQVLKYHNYPATGTGSHSYTTSQLGLQASFNFGATTFDWTNMPDIVTTSSPAAAKTAVATLMYAAGVSVDMDYTPGESGASSRAVGTALIDYFNYDKGLSFQRREWYGLYDWENLIYNSLKECGPVLLGGQSGTGGHEFVCDGYDKDGYFHINWGWAGMSDGYFLLTALDPGQQGIGGSAGGYNFNQDAIIDIRPATAASAYRPVMVSLDDMSGIGGNREVRVEGGFANMSYTTLTNVYPGLEINGAYYTATSYLKEIQPAYGPNGYTVRLNGLPAGTYTAYPAFRSDANGWQRMLSNVSTVGSLTLTVSSSGQVTVSQPQVASIEISSLKAETPLSPGKAYRITATAANKGTQEYLNTLLLALVDNAGEAAILTEYAIDLPGGESSAITIESTLPDIPAGTYTLCLAEREGEGENERLIPIGSGTPVSVVETPAPVLTATLTIDNADAVALDNITVRATVSNTGGYYYGQLRAVIFPYTSGNVTSLGEITSPTIEIPAGAVDQSITINGAFPAGEVGKQYFIVLYIGGMTISNQVPFKVAAMSGIDSIGADSPVTTVELYNLAGLRIATPEGVTSAATLAASSLPAGTYIMVCTHADGTRTTIKCVK